MTQVPTPANWFSIFALGLIWGGTFMVVSIALEGYGPLTVACARTTLGAIALSALVVALGRPMPDRAVIKHLILDRKSTRLNSSHSQQSRMPSSA